MAKRLGVILCFWAWSLQLLIFIQPMVVNYQSVMVCDMVADQFSHQHHAYGLMSTVPIKHHITHDCVFCVFHGYFYSPPHFPDIWQTIWACLFTAQAMGLLLGHLRRFIRYYFPPSHAPPVSV